MLAFRTLEFDRIVDAVAGLALTPLGTGRLEDGQAGHRVARRGGAAARHQRDGALRRAEPRFPAARRAGTASSRWPRWRSTDARSSRCSCGCSRTSWTRWSGRAPCIQAARLVPDPRTRRQPAGRFKAEVAAVRDAIDVTGEVLDDASPALPRIRDDCGSSGRSCAPRSNSSRAARTRRSTCRTRWSPSGTAASC